MNWDATAALQAFHVFCILAELWLNDQKVPDAEHYITIACIPGPKILKYGNHLDLIFKHQTSNDHDDCKDPLKVFDKFQASF